MFGKGVLGIMRRRISSMRLVPVQKSVRERRFMGHIVTCLVNASGVNRKKCSKETGFSTFCWPVRHVPDEYAERVFR